MLLRNISKRMSSNHCESKSTERSKRRSHRYLVPREHKLLVSSFRKIYLSDGLHQAERSVNRNVKEPSEFPKTCIFHACEMESTTKGYTKISNDVRVIFFVQKIHKTQSQTDLIRAIECYTSISDGVCAEKAVQKSHQKLHQSCRSPDFRQTSSELSNAAQTLPIMSV